MLLILKLCAYIGYNMHEFHFSIINRDYQVSIINWPLGLMAWESLLIYGSPTQMCQNHRLGPIPRMCISNKFPEGILLLVLDVTWRTKCSEASQVIIIFSSLLSFSPRLGKLHRKLSQMRSPRGLSVLQTPGSQAEAVSVSRGRLVLRALGTRVYLTDKPTVGAQQAPQANSPSLGVLYSLSPSVSK